MSEHTTERTPTEPRPRAHHTVPSTTIVLTCSHLHSALIRLNSGVLYCRASAAPFGCTKALHSRRNLSSCAPFQCKTMQRPRARPQRTAAQLRCPRRLPPSPQPAPRSRAETPRVERRWRRRCCNAPSARPRPTVARRVRWEARRPAPRTARRTRARFCSPSPFPHPLPDRCVEGWTQARVRRAGAGRGSGANQACRPGGRARAGGADCAAGQTKDEDERATTRRRLAGRAAMRARGAGAGAGDAWDGPQTGDMERSHILMALRASH